MAAETPARASSVPEVPGRLGADLALAGLVVLYGLIEVGIIATDLGIGRAVAAGVFVLAQVPLVLLRRRRPRAAFAGLAVLMPLQLLVSGSVPSLAWSVLAFAVMRAPGTAGWLLVSSFAASVAVTALVRGVGGSRSLVDSLGFAAGFGISIGVFVLIGAVLGRTTRTGRDRDERERTAAESARLAGALERERARIADEIGSGVLTGLRRLTARAAALRAPDVPDSAVAALHDDARAVLAGMRRVLGALREPADVTDGSAPPERRRRTLPAPTRSGLVLLAVFGVPAAGLAALPTSPSGEPRIDRLLAMLDLPLTMPLAFAVVSVQLATVAWWRSAPLTALLVSSVASIVSALLGGTNLLVEGTWSVLVYGAAVGARPLVSGLVTLAATLILLGGYLVLETGFTAGVPGGELEVAGSFLLVPLLWLAGVFLWRHRRRTESQRRARSAADEQDVVERERLRVARELHDVVAHHVSAITVQAGAARTTSDPEIRTQALAHIAESGARIEAALPELDGLTPDPGGVALTGAGLEELVAPVRGSGVPVDVRTSGTPADPPGDAELFAQRIVTEALTNVVRHAGPSATRVELEHGPAAVSVLVADAGRVAGHRPSRAGSGLGLVGMRERVALLGGSLEAGAEPGGGWAVRALLPRLPGPGAPGPVPAGRVPAGPALVPAEETGATISSPTTTRPSPGTP